MPTVWKDYVSIVAINCADDANLPVCREAGIKGVPTSKACKQKKRNKVGNFKLITSWSWI